MQEFRADQQRQPTNKARAVDVRPRRPSVSLSSHREEEVFINRRAHWSRAWRRGPRSPNWEPVAVATMPSKSSGKLLTVCSELWQRWSLITRGLSLTALNTCQLSFVKREASPCLRDTQLTWEDWCGCYMRPCSPPCSLISLWWVPDSAEEGARLLGLTNHLVLACPIGSILENHLTISQSCSPASRQCCIEVPLPNHTAFSSGDVPAPPWGLNGMGKLDLQSPLYCLCADGDLLMECIHKYLRIQNGLPRFRW